MPEVYLLKKEFFPKYNISTKQWERRREDLLFHLEAYFNFSIDESKKPIRIVIYDVLKEYEPLPRKGVIGSVEKMKDYTIYVDKELSIEPYNTAANLGRNAKELQKKYMHAESTSTTYCGKVLKDGLHTRTGNRKRKKIINGQYEPLTPEETQFLNELIQTHFQDFSDQQIDIIAEMAQGTISDEEILKELKGRGVGIWLEICKEFRTKFNSWPVSVPEWEISAY